MDLPRNKKTGKKLADQVRIERQAAKSPTIIKNKQMIVIPGINTQIPLGLHYNKEVTITGELDIFPTPFFQRGKLRPAIVDLKWTGDAEGTYGPYPWGTPQFIDHLQADMYHALVRYARLETLKELFPEFESKVGYDNVFTSSVQKAIDSDEIIFMYWIMEWNKRVDDYAPDDYESGIKFVERAHTDLDGGIGRQAEMRGRIDMAIGLLLDQYDKWEPRPDVSQCTNCPVSEMWGGYCKLYQEKQII